MSKRAQQLLEVRRVFRARAAEGVLLSVAPAQLCDAIDVDNDSSLYALVERTTALHVRARHVTCHLLHVRARHAVVVGLSLAARARSSWRC